jgi:hypothetical protein
MQSIAWTREKCVRIFAHKNTGDLQGENPQKYNIRRCNREKKGNRDETIENNEKNRRKQSKNNAPGGPRSSRQRKNPPMSSGGRQIAPIRD